MKTVTKKHSFPYLLLLCAAVAASYANSLFNGFTSDDRTAIVTNRLIGDFQSVIAQWYIIFQPLLYFIIFNIVGAVPVFYRTLNILFHLGTVLILFFLISKLHNKKLAFIVALISAVHPLMTESVTWISGGNYSRYAFFLLASLWVYTFSSKNKWFYMGSIFLSQLAMVNSEKAIIFPLIVTAYEYIYGDMKTNWRRLIPFFALSLAWTFFYLIAVAHRIAETVAVHTIATAESKNILLTFPVAITSYLQLIVWPDALTLYHSELHFSYQEFTIRAFITLFFLGGLFFSLLKRYVFGFWLALFVFALLPVLLPLGISSIIAERYVYLSSIGIFFCIGYLFYILIKDRSTRILGYIVLLIIIVGLMTRTVIRNRDWIDDPHLWMATAQVSPSSSQNHNSLGFYYKNNNDLVRAEYEFKRAIELDPSFATAYFNLGDTYLAARNIEAAKQAYETSIKLNATIWQAHMNLASILFAEKKLSGS